MVLHGAVGQNQPFGDLLVRQTGADHPQDFGLAFGEPRRVGSGVAGKAPELTEHEACQPGGEHRVSRSRPPHRVEKLRAARGLQDVAGSASLHRAEHIAMLAAGRQDQHLGGRVGREEAAGDIHPRDIGELEVEHNHVRSHRSGDPHGLSALAGGGDDFEASIAQVAAD